MIDYCTILTDKEEKEVRAKSANNGWGFSPATIREELLTYATGDEKAKAKVCYLLEDCNYHTLCRLLYEEDFKSAVKWVRDNLPLNEEAA